MAWHPIQCFRRQCCMKVESIKFNRGQQGQAQGATGPCKQTASCLLCAGFAHLEKTMRESYETAETLKTLLDGALDDPQCPLKAIDEGTQWEHFYLAAMQFLVNEKYTRKCLSHLGARALPRSEIIALAFSGQLRHSSILVEIRSVKTSDKGDQYFVRVTKDMGSWL